MNREIHLRFWEGPGVRFPQATHFRPGLHDRSGRVTRKRRAHAELLVSLSAQTGETAVQGSGVNFSSFSGTTLSLRVILNSVPMPSHLSQI